MQAELITRDHTDPNVSGVAAAARLGNSHAVRVAADRLRDQGKGGAAASLDILACEFETRQLQARQLRQVLASGFRVAREPDENAELADVRRLLEAEGLPLDCYAVARGGGGGGGGTPYHFLLLVPTDGQEQAATAALLVAYLKVPFPAARFVAWTENRAITAAGRAGERILDELEADQAGDGPKRASRRSKRAGEGIV